MTQDQDSTDTSDASEARAQADLDQLRLWSARRSAMKAGGTFIELDADLTAQWDGGDEIAIGVIREHAERMADERSCPVHVIRCDGTVAEIVRPASEDGSAL